MKERPKQLENVLVTCDSTNHFWFVCGDCQTRMRIKADGVQTQRSDDRTGTVTMFFLVCPNCKGEGYRKVYWNDGSRGVENLAAQLADRPQ